MQSRPWSTFSSIPHSRAKSIKKCCPDQQGHVSEGYAVSIPEGNNETQESVGTTVCVAECMLSYFLIIYMQNMFKPACAYCTSVKAYVLYVSYICVYVSRCEKNCFLHIHCSVWDLM